MFGREHLPTSILYFLLGRLFRALCIKGAVGESFMPCTLRRRGMTSRHIGADLLSGIVCNQRRSIVRRGSLSCVVRHRLDVSGLIVWVCGHHPVGWHLLWHLLWHVQVLHVVVGGHGQGRSAIWSGSPIRSPCGIMRIASISAVVAHWPSPSGRRRPTGPRGSGLHHDSALVIIRRSADGR